MVSRESAREAELVTGDSNAGSERTRPRLLSDLAGRLEPLDRDVTGQVRPGVTDIGLSSKSGPWATAGLRLSTGPAREGTDHHARYK